MPKKLTQEEFVERAIRFTLPKLAVLCQTKSTQSSISIKIKDANLVFVVYLGEAIGSTPLCLCLEEMLALEDMKALKKQRAHTKMHEKLIYNEWQKCGRRNYLLMCIML